MNYLEFLEKKKVLTKSFGFEAKDDEFLPTLKPHQRDICKWAIKGGSRAIFASFGLGKTLMQLQILHYICQKTGGKALVIAPLGVKHEFQRDARNFIGIEVPYIRTNEAFEKQISKFDIFVTNYERVRDGNLDPNLFEAVSLDEASVLRSFGSKTYQTFLELFKTVKYRFVCTATPSPNRYKELIHYAGFLGIMDTGQALTRFFKRDSQKAGNLTLHPHKEEEFWLWVSSWAVFLNKPSDLGYSDEGYSLPDLKVIEHRIAVDHSTAGTDSWGQGKLFRDAALSLRDACTEKRDSLQDRVSKMLEIINTDPDAHWLIWHDLESERHAIKKALPEATSIYGSQDLEKREEAVIGFSEGDVKILSTKPVLCGSGCNFQRHCHKAIYLGIGYKFNDFIQSVHRIYRYLQDKEVEIHIIHTESEDQIYAVLMEKWRKHNELVEKMTSIVKKYGLNLNLKTELNRYLHMEREEVKGKLFTCVNNDNVLELQRMEDESIDLIVTSWPFSNHYEYTPTYNDFGHTTDDDEFFEQMDYLTPETLRVLKGGRMYCLHVKDRILYGSVTGTGMYHVNPFSDKCVAHMMKHGFIYCGRIVIDTDVVRENQQTKRLGYSEMLKDGTKMGVGSLEYILLFRKQQSDRTKSYADERVPKSKEEYSLSAWQLDASAIWRSNGDTFLTKEKIQEMSAGALTKVWRKFASEHTYDYEHHVAVLKAREEKGLLPTGFMLLQPECLNKDFIWEDITRMQTLNTQQYSRKKIMHICPLQLDLVKRLIVRYSNPGDLVMDPFGGLMTVPYVAIKEGRRGYGIELNYQYWADGVNYCKAAEYKMTVPTIFDVIEATNEIETTQNEPIE